MPTGKAGSSHSAHGSEAARRGAARERSVRSTRGHRSDEAFLELLEEDFGISQFSLRSAFLGIPSAPKKQAIAVCEWAVTKAHDPEEAGDLIRRWARNRRVGLYHPDIAGAPPLTFPTFPTFGAFGGESGFETGGA